MRAPRIDQRAEADGERIMSILWCLPCWRAGRRGRAGGGGGGCRSWGSSSVQKESRSPSANWKCALAKLGRNLGHVAVADNNKISSGETRALVSAGMAAGEQKRASLLRSTPYTTTTTTAATWRGQTTRPSIRSCIIDNIHSSSIHHPSSLTLHSPHRRLLYITSYRSAPLRPALPPPPNPAAAAAGESWEFPRQQCRSLDIILPPPPSFLLTEPPNGSCRCIS